jgi:hypothetical protein
MKPHDFSVSFWPEPLCGESGWSWRIVSNTSGPVHEGWSRGSRAGAERAAKLAIEQMCAEVAA